MKKVIVSVAPIAADAAYIDPKETAEEILRCADEGASMVHLHVRDRGGRLTADRSLFSDILTGVREKSDIVIEASTGGVSELTIEERCAPLEDSRVELASLNVGSVNLGDAVYRNSFPDICYCAKKIAEKKIMPDIEVFEIGMIYNIAMVSDQLQLPPARLYNIVLGQIGAMPATFKALSAFLPFIPHGALWAFTHYRREDFLLARAALALGTALVRVGFEDSKWLEKGVEAQSNAAQVKRAVEIIRETGMDAATPKEARQILGL